MLIALEFVAASNWFGPYFSFGLPIYIRHAGTHPGAEPSAQALEQLMQNRPNTPRVRFKAIAPRLTAFREAFFESGNRIRYLPVMHSAVSFDLERGGMTITGYLNWYVLFILVYMLLRSLDEPAFILVAVLIVVVLGLSYLMQWGINQAVTTALSVDPHDPASS